MTNNQGIAHLAYRDGGFPVCKNRRGFVSVTADKFATEYRPCKRCQKIFDKWQAKKERKAAGE